MVEVLVSGSLLLHFFIAAQQLPSQPPHIRRDINADTAAIIEAVIHERLTKKEQEAPPGDYLVVADHSVRFCPDGTGSDSDETCIPPPMYEPMSAAGMLPLVPEELKSRLVQENRKSTPLPPIRIATARVVSNHTIAKIFSGKGWWPEFYRQFPGSRGYIEVTRPVFSADNQNALLYVSHSCGGLCGTGWLVYLSRAGRAWHIVDQHMLWIS